MCRPRWTQKEYTAICKRRYNEQKPKPLPKRGRYALSPPPRTFRRSKRPRLCKESTRGELHLPFPQSSQVGCLLLQRLPVEIRMQIWEHVVGGQTIHVLRKKGKLGHVSCAGRREGGCLQCGHGIKEGAPLQKRVEPLERDELLVEWSTLNLLVSCRQIYSEAIDILYTSNVFDFHELWALTFFRSTILPKRLALIRSVYIEHTFNQQQFGDMYSSYWARLVPYPTAASEWDSAYTTLSGMHGLRELRFCVPSTYYRQQSGIHNLVNVFSKLKDLKVGKKSIVIQVGGGGVGLNPDVEFLQGALSEKGVQCRVVARV